MAANKPVSEAIDETFDNIEAQIEETKKSIEILKQKEPEVTTEWRRWALQPSLSFFKENYIWVYFFFASFSMFLFKNILFII